MNGSASFPNSNTQRRADQLSQAHTIWLAHRCLLAMVGGDSGATAQAGEAAVQWLSERQLIEEVMDDEGEFVFEVTLHGREAVLGKQTRTVLN